ncbi:MAG: SufE family protein [Planctomycetota bacterium]|nr:SufE family protein [Planctomycetota bacterium]
MTDMTTMTIEELIEEFDDMEDWEEQCDYLIDLGFELPEFPDEARTVDNIVRGCQSRVWLVAETAATDSGEPVIQIQADSDAMIVRGLIAILLMVYSGRTVDEILSTDIRAIFRRLGLNQHLSSQRKNGLLGMVMRVQSIASKIRDGE